MIFYFGLNIIFAFFAALELIGQRNKNTNILFIVSIVTLFLFSFIRWETGTDWNSYAEMYSWIRVPWDSFDSGMEYGFLFIEHLAKTIFDNYTGVLFLFAVIIYGNMIVSYPKLCKYPMVALWITFCISFANMLFVRQNIAVAILITSLIPVYHKNLKLFIVLVFIASLFHRTSWAFLMVYPIFNHFYKQRTIIICTIICIISGLVMSKIILTIIGSIFSGIIEKKINAYVDAGVNDNSMNYSTTFILIKGIINRCFLLIFFLFKFNENVRGRNRLVNGLFNTYILGTILYCILLPISISLARVAVYMDVTQAFLVAYILGTQKTVINRLLLFTTFAIYYIIRFYTYTMSYEDEFIPYKTIFN